MVTHIHPDHYGLAGRVRETSDAWIALHPADAALIHDRYEEPTDLLERMGGMLRKLGAPRRASSRSCGTRRCRCGPFVDFVEPDVLMEDGDKPDMPGLGPHRAVDARPLPRSPLLLGGEQPPHAHRRLRAPAHHPERQPQPADRARSARRLPPLARAAGRVRRRRGAPRARVALRRPPRAPARDPRPPRAPLRRGDRRGPRRLRHHLGDRAPHGLVAPVGPGRRVHAPSAVGEAAAHVRALEVRGIVRRVPGDTVHWELID